MGSLIEIANDQMNRTVAKSLCIVLKQGINCLSSGLRLNPDTSCPTIFEFSHCWTETPYGERLETDCPVLSPFLQSYETTYRDCSPTGYFLNGTADSERPAGWHGIRETHDNYLTQNCSGYRELNDDEYDDYPDYSSDETYSLENLRLLTLILKLLLIFSCLSFICILLSLLLMSTFLRKCTRVYIHMNLLFAFMFRSFLFIWSQVTFIWKTPRMEDKYNYLPSLIDDLAPYEYHKFEQEDLSQMEEHYDNYCVAHMNNEKTFLFLCQLYPILQNYSVLACFGWLTCEGLYLVLLQKLPCILFKKCNPMHWFILLGWGFPGAVVGLWSYVMYTRPEGNLQCFSETQYDNLLVNLI
ncbi:unnamed protein product [Oikopleura dioica]|uniref:G-protein coupled receptors family 2 profile 2 domain-containing protein n=1 Tax=Oikopleura dioica TaxID=34765 RepID=E4YEI0_OIKDI|nr:unnamed protein product [Oikopleura dioica]